MTAVMVANSYRGVSWFAVGKRPRQRWENGAAADSSAR
jgi:hypothetical protein